MPRATNNYPFEEEVLNGLANLTYQLTGKITEAGNGLKLILSENGCLLSVYSQSLFPDFRDQEKEAVASILYDPFDWPEYTYISWNNVKQETLERMLNIQFTPQHFESYDGDLLEQFPLNFDVMF